MLNPGCGLSAGVMIIAHLKSLFSMPVTEKEQQTMSTKLIINFCTHCLLDNSYYYCHMVSIVIEKRWYNNNV